MSNAQAPRTPQRRDRLGYGFGALAVLTCPCHLPILVLVLGGTTAGAFLADHLAVAIAVATVLFGVSLVAAIRLLRSDPPA